MRYFPFAPVLDSNHAREVQLHWKGVFRFQTILCGVVDFLKDCGSIPRNLMTMKEIENQPECMLEKTEEEKKQGNGIKYGCLFACGPYPFYIF